MSSRDSKAKVLERLQVGIHDFDNDNLESRQEFLALLRKTQQEIEGPAGYLSRVRFEPLNNMCQLVAIETGLICAIVESGSKSVTASELSRQTSQERSLVVRVLRLLAVHGVVEETDVETYRSNDISERLNTPAEEGAIRDMVDLMFPIAGRLVPQLRAPGGLKQFADETGDVTPFRAAYGPQSMFEYLGTHADHKKAFDQFMESRKSSIRKAWCDLVDMETWKDGNSNTVRVVDVGGGKGQDLVALKRKYPDFPGRLVVQDLPATFNDVEESQMDGVELMPHDMFSKQPIRGAQFYAFSAILHDWSDTRCLQILQRTAAAMTPGYSKILIHDMVLKDKGEGMRGASLDIAMLMMPEGMERTKSAFEELLNNAGLRIVRLWPGNPGAESVIEAELQVAAGSASAAN